VLDVCHAMSVTSARKDRFVVALKGEGTRLRGSGQTQEGKQRVAVDILRKPAGKMVNFEGSITLGAEKCRGAERFHRSFTRRGRRAG
jgi:hypothetical protein